MKGVIFRWQCTRPSSCLEFALECTHSRILSSTPPFTFWRAKSFYSRKSNTCNIWMIFQDGMNFNFSQNASMLKWRLGFWNLLNRKMLPRFLVLDKIGGSKSAPSKLLQPNISASGCLLQMNLGSSARFLWIHPTFATLFCIYSWEFGTSRRVEQRADKEDCVYIMFGETSGSLHNSTTGRCRFHGTTTFSYHEHSQAHLF